jgi:putative acetyltransferase
MFRIEDGDLTDPRVVGLLELHLIRSRAETAPGSAHALEIGALRHPDISFWTIWDSQNLTGMGALKRLGSDHGEVKSMRTVKEARRTGAASAMLGHIVSTARTLGMKRLSLETGSWAYFRPARTFYRKHGFVECAPFGEYALDPNSVFMTRNI